MNKCVCELLSVWGYFKWQLCMWSNFNINQVGHFDTIEIWPKLSIRVLYISCVCRDIKENFWMKIKLLETSAMTCDKVEIEIESDGGGRMGVKKHNRRWNVLFMPKVSKRNKFATVFICVYYWAKSFNDFLCDDIGCFYSKDRQDFPFDKTNKITLTMHKAT